MDDDAALQLQRADQVVGRVKRAGHLAIGGAVAIPVLGLLGGTFPVVWVLIPFAWLLQVGFGITATIKGRRGARELDALMLPVASAERDMLWRWASIGSIVAILGFVGAALVAVLGALAVMSLGALAGAWGRPLRVGGKSVGARLGQGRRWAAGPTPDVSELGATNRRALGLMWLHDAKKEHGSVPAFADLTWSLAGLGAPAELLARCQRSALQEIDHAQRCFAVTETYLDTTIGVGPVPEIVAGRWRTGGRLAVAKRIALETLEDGCLIEDLNADFADRAAALATDPAMVELTALIAIEEREHAELAWDILRFCVALHPGVAAAVRKRIPKLPVRILAPYDTGALRTIAAADEDVLARHGRVPLAEWSDLYARRRSATVVRALALLDATGPSMEREPAIAAVGT